MPCLTFRSSRLASAKGTSSGRTKVAERTRWHSCVSPGGAVPCCRASALARHDDRIVGGDEILLRAVLDRTHALLHGSILDGDAADPAVGAARFLGATVDHVVVILIDDRPEGTGDQLDMDAAAFAHCVELH